MKYKEFLAWCYQRACDGCWGFNEALLCTDIIHQVANKPFWKREKEWQKINMEYSIENNIIFPINNKIAEVYKNHNF